MKETTKTIGLYYGLSGLNRFGYSFIFGTYVLFMMSRGVSLLQINLINAVYYTVVILFEIPTGVVADLFGRKVSYLIASVLLSTAMCVYYYAHGFLQFSAAEALAALGSAFLSGAFQAWLVDRLKKYNYDKPLGTIFSRVSFTEQIAGILGAVSGGYLADRNLSAPWLVAGAAMALCGIIAVIFMKEDQRVRMQKFSFGVKYVVYVNLLRSAFHTCRKNANVLFLMVLGAALWFAEQGPNMQWQPHFKSFSLTKSGSGWTYAAITVALSVGALLSTYLVRWWKNERRAVIVATMAMGVAIAVAGQLKVLPAALGMFLLFEVLRGAYKPISDSLINKNINSGQRATTLSFASLVYQSGGWIGLIASGYLADSRGIPFAWLISGGFLLAATLWLALWVRRK